MLPGDLTMRDVAFKLGASISSVDGKALKTFKMLLADPGGLTVAHINGQRRAYVSPLKVFLIANALFFAVQSATRTAILSSTLDSHLTQQDWKSVAGTMVAAHLQANHITLEQFRPAFDTAVEIYAKSLIILMAVVLAPVLALVFKRSHRPIGAHVVFALHLYAFVLLLFCFSLGLTELDILAGGTGLASPRFDTAVSIFNMVVCLGYLYLAVGKGYGITGFPRTLVTIFLALCVSAIVIGYRFLMFVVTLYWT